MNFGTSLWYPLPLSESCSGNLEGEEGLSREAGWCLSWKAAHKPNVKHHSTHSPPGSAFTPGCRQGAQPADGCSKSLVPLVPMFQHAQENKGGRKWWHMDLFRGKKRAEEQQPPQHRMALVACHGWEVFPMGIPSPGRMGAPYLPCPIQHCPEQELLGVPAAKPQLQSGSRAGY